MPSEKNSNNSSQAQTQRQKNQSVVKNEDVEFSSEAADSNDIEAQQRAARANNQQNNKQNNQQNSSNK
jgi:hypothetical protein